MTTPLPASDLPHLEFVTTLTRARHAHSLLTAASAWATAAQLARDGRCPLTDRRLLPSLLIALVNAGHLERQTRGARTLYRRTPAGDAFLVRFDAWAAGEGDLVREWLTLERPS